MDLPLLSPTSFHTRLGRATMPKTGRDGRWVGAEELGGTNAHTGRRSRGRGVHGGAQGAHWGRALRMAFTSSATAVSANSNWSCARPVTEGSGEAQPLPLPKGTFIAGMEGCRAFGRRGGRLEDAGGAECCWSLHGGHEESAWGGEATRNGRGGTVCHLRADKAGSLVTDMLQGGSDINLLHSWG